jgi:Tol biopolymer transport system component
MRFSPDGRLIAYQQGKASDYADLDIYVVPTAGGQPTAILSDSFIDELAGWAPDGTGLVSISDREGAPGFWLVRVSDGKPAGKPRLLKAYVGPPGMITTLTRNGSLFYGTSGGRQDVWVATVDLISGRLLEGPTRIGRGTAQSSPAWSPDGKYLAYLSVMGMTSSPNTNFISTADTLSLLALETGQTRHFAVPIAMSLIYSIHWSSDGRSIVVAGVKRDVSQGGTPASWPGLYRIDAQTGEASPIGTYHGGGSAALSQDGKTLFYATGGPTGWGVFARDVKTGDEHVILKEDRRGSGSVAVSPDGKWLAVDSFPYANYGEYVLRILPADGGEARELYRAQMDFPFYSVAWSADSRHVLFAIAGPDRKRAYWYMPLAGGSPVRIDLAMPGMRLLSLHPDGRRIAFATRERRSDELWVLENFLPPAKPTPKTSARR